MKLLVSSCLLGEKVRYDAKGNKIDSKLFESIINSHQIFSFCPEVQGGLPTPRPAAEIHDNKVISSKNIDFTNEFEEGALKALTLCKEENIVLALLKAKSPSCGNKQIYDGTFSGKLINGMGICAKKLQAHNIVVYNENELETLVKAINDLELK